MSERKKRWNMEWYFKMRSGFVGVDPRRPAEVSRSDFFLEVRRRASRRFLEDALAKKAAWRMKNVIPLVIRKRPRG